ncbi:Uridine nucleosidase 1 [Hypocenomyce scalaris]|nr:Uridine nucleosidase 1 [Hypocenomyce scalaris]
MKQTGKEKVPVWLDVDTGNDDVFALLIAAHHPSLTLLGTSTTHGNASLTNTTKNTSMILTALGRTDVAVYPGAAKPFCRDEVVTFDIHGSTGLGGISKLPEPKASIMKDANAILAMREALLATPANTAWLVATGPLTNAALLFATFPEVASHIAGLSIMGGAVGGGFTAAKNGRTDGSLEKDANERFGNETDWAEFNIYCDPEAARSVFSNPVLAPKTSLITLDLTHLCLATTAVREKLLKGGDVATPTDLRVMLEEILAFFTAGYDTHFGMADGPPLHDPLAVAVLLPDSAIFEDDGSRYDVRMVTVGEHVAADGEDLETVRGQIGRTVVTTNATGKGVRIPRALNVDVFWQCLSDCCSVAERKAGSGEGKTKIL